MVLVYVIPVAFALVAAVAGVIRSGAARPDRPALAAVALFGIGSALLAVGTYDPEVPAADAVGGVLAAGVMLGAGPAYVYFALGRALAEHRVVLGLVCAASAVPLVYYYLLGWLLVLAAVHCPPDAYECPF